MITAAQLAGAVLQLNTVLATAGEHFFAAPGNQARLQGDLIGLAGVGFVECGVPSARSCQL